MSGKMEADDSVPKQEGASADFSNQLFSPEDQRAVFKSASKSDDSAGFKLEDGGRSQSAVKRMEHPHGWYENSNANYKLPTEAVVSGGIRHILQSGWRKLEK